MKQTRTVVVTGFQGQVSAVLKAFEDMGFYCVDNLPLVLLSAFVEFAQGRRCAVFAIGIDIREKGFPERLPALYSSLKAGGRAINTFLDASIKPWCAVSARRGGLTRSHVGLPPHRRYKK
jgi:UPF0042 nucleotide-binding protein